MFEYLLYAVYMYALKNNQDADPDRLMINVHRFAILVGGGEILSSLFHYKIQLGVWGPSVKKYRRVMKNPKRTVVGLMPKFRASIV